jgi:hypothetical protein
MPAIMLTTKATVVSKLTTCSRVRKNTHVFI